MKKYKIELQPQAKEELRKLQAELKTLLAGDRTWCQNRYMDTFNERVYNRLCTLT